MVPSLVDAPITAGSPGPGTYSGAAVSTLGKTATVYGTRAQPVFTQEVRDKVPGATLAG